MGKLWKALKRKLFTDRADSILVPAMILAPVMALTLGISVEVVKNSYIRTERINAIQDSASAAVGLTDSRGSLDWKVVDKIVNEYEHNRFGKKVFSRTSGLGTSVYDDTTRETANSQAFNGFNAGEEGCLVGHGDTEGQKYPQYKVTLNTARGEMALPAASRTVSFTRTQPDVQQLNNTAPLLKSYKNPADGATAPAKPVVYRSVTVEIIDQTPNLMMGLAGVPCQKFDLTASSVTFSASSDLID